MRRHLVVPVAALALANAGCHRHHSSTVVAVSVTPACSPVSAPLDPTSDVGLLAGTFAVTFVPTAGSRAGAAPVMARLEARAQDSARVTVDAAARIAQPVIGVMTVDIAALGASAIGATTASDPDGPGVGVYTTRDSAGALTSLVARVGALSNRRDLTPYDAGHFTMFVRRVAADGFAGGWSSSRGAGATTPDASGHFCAVRVG